MQVMETVQAKARESAAPAPPSDKTVLVALANRFSREIVLSTMQNGKSIEELSAEAKIPLSTCYRRVAELTASGVLVVERIVITGSGKKYSIYKAAVSGVRVELVAGHMSVQTIANEDAVERLNARWLSTRYK